MKPSFISFVGIDQSTNFNDLLSFKNSKYEFGVLHSEGRNGKDPRYPGTSFCKEFLQFTNDNSIDNSLHLCGSSIDGFLNEDKNIIDLCFLAGRIQLNLNINKYSTKYSELANIILDLIQKHSFNIILQMNNSKREFNKTFFSKINKFTFTNCSLSLLHDSSGGFGRKITEIYPPYKKFITGYAGGINETNILSVIKSINDINYDENNYYVDMESGVRVDNKFSIEKCLAIKNLIDNIDW